MFSTQLATPDKKEISESSVKDDELNSLHTGPSFTTLTRYNIVASIDDEIRAIPFIPNDKLHRRNPVTVRQEIQCFDDLISETSFSDLQLNEMPGLQNTEQWKRIANRSIETSPPLSRQYFQTAAFIFDSQNGHIPDVLGSYRRPGRTESEQNTPTPPASPSILQTRRRKILLGLSILTIIIAVIVAIAVALVLIRKPGEITTDCYPGSIFVGARFDPLLLSSSSVLAVNYQTEFCSLVSTTLSDAKTKYAIFFSTCTVNNFRNGTIIADFILGFTRYQNATRLNTFLNRTLINKQLFGGTVLSIEFNSTTDTKSSNTDYNTDYNGQYSGDYSTDYNDSDSTTLAEVPKQARSLNKQITLTPSEMESFESNA